MTRQQHITLRWYCHWRAILGEFVATSLLLSLGCLACVPLDGLHPNPPLYAPLGFGMIVILCVEVFKHISGALMNPAMSIASVICGNISISLGIAFSIAQCAGATVGYGILVIYSPKNLLPGDVCVNQPHPEHTIFQAVFVEIFFTAALSLIVCSMWDPVNKDKTEANGLKFGLVVIGLAIGSGPLGGVSMNPARSLGPAIWTGRWTAHWLYWVGPYIGAIVATVFYKYIWMKVEKCKQTTVQALTLDVKGDYCI